MASEQRPPINNGHYLCDPVVAVAHSFTVYPIWVHKLFLPIKNLLLFISDEFKSETELSLDSKLEDSESSPSSSPSTDDFESEFLALVSEEDKEKKHSKRLFEIPNPASGLAPICFTSEESLRIDELIRIDRESMIAFGDTLREKNRVNSSS